MKALLSTFALLMQGYSRRDIPMLEHDAQMWEMLYDHHLMRGDKAQASICKKEAEDKRLLARQLV